MSPFCCIVCTGIGSYWCTKMADIVLLSVCDVTLEHRIEKPSTNNNIVRIHIRKQRKHILRHSHKITKCVYLPHGVSTVLLKACR